MDKIAGHLEIGTNGKGEIVVNHPELQVDADGLGFIVFSPSQARAFAETMKRKADDADREIERRLVGKSSERNIQEEMLMLTDQERKQVAARAVRDAEIDALKKSRDWRIRVGKQSGDGSGLRDAVLGEVFCESQTIGRREIVDFIAELMVERDEWKRRAEKHGCDVEGGDSDCE